MNRPGLLAWVDEKLRANWSPEQIAGRIRLEYPEDQSMRISTGFVLQPDVFPQHPAVWSS